MVQRRGEVAELVEGARLEIVYTLIAYQGFESPPLRQEKIPEATASGIFCLMKYERDSKRTTASGVSVFFIFIPLHRFAIAKVWRRGVWHRRCRG